MKVYDISQEVFGCEIYPGDPAPEREWISRIDEGEVCNITAFRMCAHNGTHADAPYHFLREGKTIDGIDLRKFVGYAYVTEHEGPVTAPDAERILTDAEKAGQERNLSDEPAKRILVKGDAVVTPEAAEVFANAGISLFGNESQSVGPADAPMKVHLTMLGAEIVLLEGIRLSAVPEGVYLLSAAPLNLGGADGAPVRAVLIEL